jgi:hypothetical protein
VSSKSSSNQTTTEEPSSNDSKFSKLRSKVGLPSRSTDAPTGETVGSDTSSSDTKLVIQRNESFELNEISLTEKEMRAESRDREREDVFSYNHFDPRMDFNGHDIRRNYHAF